ncbi:MAG: HAMP domain-containing histidine kinase [Acidobacteriota bacterium]|nr:HAMP domain-containing histidine kinase [Acidobacteriota bacterium]
MKTREPSTGLEAGGRHAAQLFEASVVKFAKLRRPRALLAFLFAVAILPATALVYLQYRSLSQVQERMQQALFVNLRQAVIGARVEARIDISSWYSQAFLGPVLHDWLRQRNLTRIQHVAETTRRICPYVRIFFAYRLRPHADAEILVFRAGPEAWSMHLSRADPAEPQIRRFVQSLKMTSSHRYPAMAELDGQRQQLILHLVDDDALEPVFPHTGELGYYGMAIPACVLAKDYFPMLLQKHLSRLATFGQVPGERAMSAIYDENGVQLSVSEKGVVSSFPVQAAVSEGRAETGILPGWTMRAGFPPKAEARSDRSEFYRNIAIVLVIAAMLLAAIISLGVITAREIQLARAKTEFVANVSHEFKTPLSIIRGFVETLHLNRLGSATQRDEYFRIIEAEIYRLSSLIDTVVDVSKIDVGLKRYQPESVDVSHLIEQTLEQFSPELERQSFTIIREIDTSLPIARVDPMAFSQALLNLLSNAMKYSDGERSIVVKAALSEHYLEVSVSDRGIGIPKREQKRIFERFYRSHQTAARAYGAGLGLALVKHFADAHGGGVSVNSAPGRGSCFAILLPVPE